MLSIVYGPPQAPPAQEYCDHISQNGLSWAPNRVFLAPMKAIPEWLQSGGGVANKPTFFWTGKWFFATILEALSLAWVLTVKIPTLGPF